MRTNTVRKTPLQTLVKVIQILPELNSGGVERGTLEIASALVQAGHESIVISNGGRMVKELQDGGSRHITRPIHRKNLFSLCQVPVLRRIFLTEKPDIIHLRSRLPAWLAYLAWKSLPAGNRPHLVTTVHGFHSVNAYSSIMTRGETVICVSQSIREHIMRDYPKTDPAKLHVIHRGVDPALYHPGYQPSAEWLARWHADHPQLAGQIKLLLPGRITRLKGHEEFFQLIDQLRRNGLPVHGLIAGDTHPKKRAYLSELHSLLEKSDLSSHITFLGHRRDLREIIAVSDITYSLSRQPESFGRTALEAVALGKPMIGHAIGGVHEILTTCFPRGRVPLHDAQALFATTREILENPSAPSSIPTSFTLAAMCSSTLELYNSRVC